MNQPSGVSRRIRQCISHLGASEFEGALVNLFPAVDKTAKRRRPKANVGQRIRAFLEEEEALISYIATSNVLRGIRINGVSVTDALYKFGRNPIAHEGELDPRLHFNDQGSLEIGSENWNLPSGYIVGMTLAVIIAPENAAEHVDDSLEFRLFGELFMVNALWGQKSVVHERLNRRFGVPDAFS
jgi:hypothetical protein